MNKPNENIWCQKNIKVLDYWSILPITGLYQNDTKEGGNKFQSVLKLKRFAGVLKPQKSKNIILFL